MQSETATPTTSSAPSSPPRTDEETAKKIRFNGWWQGSVLPEDVLRSVTGEKLTEGGPRWILASQTCNLYNPDFTKIRLIEWVGAKVIHAAEINPKMRAGRNPRILHCQATGPSQEDVWLECDLQLRHWTDRKILADIEPAPISFRDDPSKQTDLQCKDIFIRWVARSYTRLELSDELGKALQDEKIEDLIGKICKAHESEIYGVFLEINDETEQTPAVEVKPPCTVEITFVAQPNSKIAEISKIVKDFYEAEVPNPMFTPGSNFPKKVKRKTLNNTKSIKASWAYKSTEEWNISDLEKTLRYSFIDYFSDSGENPAE